MNPDLLSTYEHSLDKYEHIKFCNYFAVVCALASCSFWALCKMVNYRTFRKPFPVCPVLKKCNKKSSRTACVAVLFEIEVESEHTLVLSLRGCGARVPEDSEVRASARCSDHIFTFTCCAHTAPTLRAQRLGRVGLPRDNVSRSVFIFSG